ncbi:MAG: carboxylating nicotinate-nucleotide diphosphorylase [Candidatus Hydrothermales bacterium]
MKNIYDFIEKEELIKIVKRALKEDIGKKDLTSDLIFKDYEKARFSLISKKEGILCGTEVFNLVFKVLDENTFIKWNKNEGEIFNKNEKVAVLEGKIKQILKGERVALNFLSHLSGISTQVFKLKNKAGDLIIKDTRKTIPLIRRLQKYAHFVGGGENHRMTLSEAVMIKDNHKKLKGLEEILNIIKRKKLEKKVILEVENLEEFKLALKYNIKYVILDNMNIEDIKKAVEIGKNNVFIEASGNINFENIEMYKDTGINAVSCGFLTHSVKIIDFSLEAEEVIYE